MRDIKEHVFKMHWVIEAVIIIDGEQAYPPPNSDKVSNSDLPYKNTKNTPRGLPTSNEPNFLKLVVAFYSNINNLPTIRVNAC